MRHLSLAALILLSACSSERDEDKATSETTQTTVTQEVATGPTQASETPVSSTRAPAVPASDLQIREQTSQLAFNWRVPSELGSYPAILRDLRAHANKLKAETAETARRDAVDRGPEAPFYPYSHDENWTVTASTPRLLSLQATIDSYTGGAHGMTNYATLIIDKQSTQRLGFTDLFVDPKAAVDWLTPRYCAALDAERLKRRGAKLEGDMFNDCPPLGEQVAVPVAEPNGVITAIRVMLAPYTAGPYAEGAYEIVIPVDASLTALVRSAYRSDFATVN